MVLVSLDRSKMNHTQVVLHQLYLKYRDFINNHGMSQEGGTFKRFARSLQKYHILKVYVDNVSLLYKLFAAMNILSPAPHSVT